LFMSWKIVQERRCHASKGGWIGFGINEMVDADEEAGFIKADLKGARLGNCYDHGSFLLFKLWPETKVMMDARYFPYRSWFKEYMEFEQGVNIKKFLKKYPFDALEMKYAAINNLAWFNKNKDWRLAFYGRAGAIYVKNSFGYSGPVQTGKGLDDIKSYPMAVDALNFTFLIKDWANSERILKTMERNFTCPNYRKTTAGFRFFMEGSKAYADRDYFSAVKFMGKAADTGVKNPVKYAGALMMRALENWRGGDYVSAIHDAVKSYGLFPNMASAYNIAIMGWQWERLSRHPETRMSLGENDEKFLKQWRIVFQKIVGDEYKTQAQYLFFMYNAKAVLSGRDGQVMFIRPEE
nr:hypothetical protein [Desulfobacteraceae bacterium]